MVMRKIVLTAMYSTAISSGSFRPLGAFSCTGKFNGTRDKGGGFKTPLQKSGG